MATNDTLAIPAPSKQTLTSGRIEPGGFTGESSLEPRPKRWDPKNPTPQPIVEGLIAEGWQRVTDKDIRAIVKTVSELDGKWLAVGKKIEAFGRAAAIAEFRSQMLAAVAAADGRRVLPKDEFVAAAHQSRHPLKAKQVEISVEAALAVKPLYEKLVTVFEKWAEERIKEELQYADPESDGPTAKLKAICYAPKYFKNQIAKLGRPSNTRPAHFLLGIKN